MDPTENPLQTIAQMQQFLAMWEGLLNAMGGALGPDKTKWWAIHYKWANDEWRYASEGDLPGPLYVNDPLGVRT